MVRRWANGKWWASRIVRGRKTTEEGGKKREGTPEVATESTRDAPVVALATTPLP